MNILTTQYALHTLRSEEDLSSILQSGLKRGTNITPDSRKPNQSLDGEGLTLVYNPNELAFKDKGYQSNEGIIIKQKPSLPIAVLVGCDSIIDTSPELPPEWYDKKRNYYTKNSSKFLSQIDKKVKLLVDKLKNVVEVEALPDNEGIVVVFKESIPFGNDVLYYTSYDNQTNQLMSSDFAEFIRQIVNQMKRDKHINNFEHFFHKTSIPKILYQLKKLPDTQRDIESSEIFFKNYKKDEKQKEDPNEIVKEYVKRYNIPSKLPIYYYTTDDNGTPNIEVLRESKYSQKHLLESLDSSLPLGFKRISGDGYLFDSKMNKIVKDAPGVFGDLLTNSTLIQAPTGQLFLNDDFDKSRLVRHKHLGLYGLTKGELKKTGLMPMIFVDYPNGGDRFKQSQYEPLQAIEQVSESVVSQLQLINFLNN